MDPTTTGKPSTGLSHVVSPDEFDFTKLQRRRRQKGKAGNPRRRDKRKYKDVISAFDIETSALRDVEQSIMYIWQWCFWYDPTDYCIVIGRTWEEWLWFIERIRRALKSSWIVTYVHNLSYEFQFLAGIYPFEASEVRAMEARKVLRADILDCIELRCSYLHSNMSLDLFTKSYRAEHAKLPGELDYNVRRFFYTDLDDMELSYCVNDVLGLCEALHNEMVHDGDTLSSIPLTSTGYVRRDIKRAMKPIAHNIIPRIYPDFRLYALLREAFRGGDTSCNRYYAGKILTADQYGLIHSADRTSSYPEVICNCMFPMGPFVDEKVETLDDVLKIKEDERAVIFRLQLWGVRLHDKMTGDPYIPIAKCTHASGYYKRFGRIITADYIELPITDIDLEIILDQYDFDAARVGECYSARYGRLPQPIIDQTIEYFRKKTALKCRPEDPDYILYAKSKAKLNAIYGMMASRVIRDDIIFDAGEWKEKEDAKAPEVKLGDDIKRAFLVYQWGVWTTAHARRELHEGVSCAGRMCYLYSDTDSVKYVGNADFSLYNKRKIAASKASGAYATDPKGNVHYMGVFEEEDDMIAFTSLGPKKYAYRTEDGALHITIAGVGKTAGAAELERCGGLEAFKECFVFREAGGLEALYNDDVKMEYTTEDGVIIPITRNVYLRPSTYTMSMSGDIIRMLDGIQIDMYDDLMI